MLKVNNVLKYKKYVQFAKQRKWFERHNNEKLCENLNF